MKRFLIEVVSLQSARGRLTAFTLLSTAVFFSRYHWLDHLSLWGHLGIDWAPSIGLTRAYWLLLHGAPAAAWHRNPLIFLVLLVGLPLLGRDLFLVVRSRLRPQRQVARLGMADQPEQT